jgi:hypothetical protein
MNLGLSGFEPMMSFLSLYLPHSFFFFTVFFQTERMAAASAKISASSSSDDDLASTMKTTTAKKREDLAADVGAWAMNITSSVGIIMANKQVMSSSGYGFRFGISHSQSPTIYVLGSDLLKKRGLPSISSFKLNFCFLFGEEQGALSLYSDLDFDSDS